MADHMIEVFPRLKPQGVAGLVSVDNDLHGKWKCKRLQGNDCGMETEGSYISNVIHYLLIYTATRADCCTGRGVKVVDTDI